jgi:hypothetical protein
MGLYFFEEVNGFKEEPEANESSYEQKNGQEHCLGFIT